MKIIKHGSLNPIHFKCKKCECEFAANIGEYYYAYCDGEKYCVIECPDCKNCVYELEREARPYYG